MLAIWGARPLHRGCVLHGQRLPHISGTLDRLPNKQIPPVIVKCPIFTFLWQLNNSLNFCSLVSVNNLPKSTTLSPLPTLLGFIFDEHLTFSDQISSVSKSCYYHIRQLRCIRPYLDTKTVSTIATSIVHSKLDYCNSITTSPSVRSPGFNRSRTLWHVLLSKLLNSVTPLPSSGLYTG